MAPIIKPLEGQKAKLIDSFYLHYKENGNDVYELVKIDQHTDLDPAWGNLSDLPKIEASNS